MSFGYPLLANTVMGALHVVGLEPYAGFITPINRAARRWRLDHYQRRLVKKIVFPATGDRVSLFRAVELQGGALDRASLPATTATKRSGFGERLVCVGAKTGKSFKRGFEFLDNVFSGKMIFSAVKLKDRSVRFSWRGRKD